MSPFAIFTIVLTIAYIIYYAVLITHDLKMKNTPQEDTGEENIEVDLFAPTEKPEAVKSVGEGFQVGDGHVYQPEPQPSVVTLDSDGNVQEQGLDAVLSSELRHKVGEVVEQMEDIDVESQPQVDADTYAKQMEQRHGITFDEYPDKV